MRASARKLLGSAGDIVVISAKLRLISRAEVLRGWLRKKMSKNGTGIQSRCGYDGFKRISFLEVKCNLLYCTSSQNSSYLMI